MREIQVLYDGWPLAHAPNGAAAIHLRSLLELRPRAAKATLALPGQKELDGLAEGIDLLIQEETDMGKWQQRRLPALLKSSASQIIHSTLPGAALFGQHRTAISPAKLGSGKGSASRFSAALGQGGMARAAILWPADLPHVELPGQAHSLPPIAHPAFFDDTEEPEPSLDIPDSFLLFHGSGEEQVLDQLLEAWTWAAASIGEAYPLLLLGLNEEQRRAVEDKLPLFHLQDYVHVLSELAWKDLVVLYQRCSAVIVDEGGVLWGGAARLALAAGKSVVGFKSEALNALLGNAAYLVEPGDLRAFGAAMITVVVDEGVWEKLEAAAKKRSAAWDSAAFTRELGDFYASLV